MAKPKAAAREPQPPPETPTPPVPDIPPADPAPAQTKPVESVVLPQGFQMIDKAPKDGRTIKLWFGASTKEMLPKYFVLGKWRATRELVDRRWVKSGFWCHPHSNLKIGFDFHAFQPVGQVTQQDIDASNFAVHQENERRQKAAMLRNPDGAKPEPTRATA